MYQSFNSSIESFNCTMRSWIIWKCLDVFKFIYFTQLWNASNEFTSIICYYNMGSLIYSQPTEQFCEYFSYSNTAFCSKGIYPSKLREMVNNSQEILKIIIKTTILNISKIHLKLITYVFCNYWLSDHFFYKSMNLRCFIFSKVLRYLISRNTIESTTHEWK